MTHLEEVKNWNDFLGGDLNALSLLFLHYVDGLIAYGKKVHYDEELIKDCIQEVFVKLILKRQKIKRVKEISFSEIRGFIFKMLRNQIIDEIKLINRNKKSVDLGGTKILFIKDAEHHLVESEEELERNTNLTMALGQLSTHQQEAMFLKYSNGFSYEQISETMGISTASARTLIYRSLKQLRMIVGMGQR